jgi:hypothetical protein
VHQKVWKGGDVPWNQAPSINNSPTRLDCRGDELVQLPRSWNIPQMISETLGISGKI